MPMLELTEQEWQTITVMLTKQPWDVSNPILYKMAQQAQAQVQVPVSGNGVRPIRMDGAGVVHEE